MATQVIVLNGASSSGKTGIARCLQTVLPDPWLTVGVDSPIDEVFLGGADSRQRWRQALDGLDVLWVAVRCDTEVAAGRELARKDRVSGMALSQAELVHRGVTYDLSVDTTHTESLGCARVIAAHAGSARIRTMSGASTSSLNTTMRESDQPFVAGALLSAPAHIELG